MNSYGGVQKRIFQQITPSIITTYSQYELWCKNAFFKTKKTRRGRLANHYRTSPRIVKCEKLELPNDCTTGHGPSRGSNSSGSAPINPKIKTLNLRTMRGRSAKAGRNPWRFRRVMLATFSLFENASKIAIFRLKIFGCIKTFLDSLFKYYVDDDRISTLPLKTFEKMCKLPNIFNL